VPENQRVANYDFAVQSILSQEADQNDFSQVAGSQSQALGEHLH